MGMTWLYYRAVKTAVSVPDATFRRADSRARQLGISRSELFTRALDAFLGPVTDDEITRALDAVYGESAEELGTGVRAAQLRAIGDTW